MKTKFKIIIFAINASSLLFFALTILAFLSYELHSNTLMSNINIYTNNILFEIGNIYWLIALVTFISNYLVYLWISQEESIHKTLLKKYKTFYRILFYSTLLFWLIFYIIMFD